MQPNLNEKIAQARAAGYSDKEIQSYLSGAGFAPQPQSNQLRVSTPYIAPSQPQPTTQIRGRGGTLTSLISEGGALGGAAAGAAIGSAVPVIGTAIGGVLGAGIGAFGGRLAENKIRDDRLGVTDALKEGAISAALAGPLRVGKYAQTAGKGLIAGKGAEEAFTKAAEAATKFSLRQALGQGVAETSKDLAIKQFRINPSQLTTFAKKHGDDVTAVVSKYKIGTADDIATKGINPLMSVFDDIIDNVPDIPKKNLRAILDKEVNTLLKSPVEANKLLGQRLQSQADTLLKSQPAKIPGPIAKLLRQEFDDAVNYTLNGTPERTVVKRTADSLRKLLQNAADDAGLQAPNGLGMKDLGREINKLIDLNEIVKKQANLGRGSNPLGLITSIGGATGGAAFGGPVGAGIGMAGTQAINSPTGRRVLSQAGQGIGNKLTESAAKAASQPIKQALIGAARGEAVKGLTNLAVSQPTTLEQALTVNSPETISALNNTSSAYNSATSPLAATSAATTPTNPFTPELLITAIASDPKNAALYERIYKIYEDKYKAADTAATPKALTEAQQARQDVNTLATEALARLRTGKIKTGIIAGRLEQTKGILGKADQATLEFNTVISNLLGTIAKARGGTSLTPNEQRLLQQYAPKVGDSRQQLETKLNAILNQFGTNTNTTVMSPQEQMLQLLSQGGAQ